MALGAKELEVNIPKVLKAMPYIRLLVLFGSQARGDANEGSDWDFAVLYDEEQRKKYETDGWLGVKAWSVLEEVFNLSDEELDVVDLGRCSEILAHYVASDGKLLYERASGEFDTFKEHALKTSEQLKVFRQEMRTRIKQKLENLKELQRGR